MLWVYMPNTTGEWAVGFFKPDGDFVSIKCCKYEDEAATRVNYLNGGAGKNGIAYKW